MSHFGAQPAGSGGYYPGFDDHPWARSGPPLPLKILAVAAAFALFHPLGIALVAYFVWQAARRNGGCGFQRSGGTFGRGPWRSHRRFPSNLAFEDHARETLRELDEEAEAFAEFERRQREARDREAFERFLGERKPQAPGETR